MATEKTTTQASVSDFDFLLKSVETKEADGEGRPTVRVTASSTEIDLATDRFAMSALKQMEQQFPGMTIFLNHKYDVPDDVFGSVKSAELVERDGHTDLDLIIEVEMSNQRAVDTYSMVKGGTTLGVSVGVLVMDADVVKDDTTKGMEVLEISEIYTLEASVVGIPANRRSWVQGAMKAASTLASKGGPVTHLSDGTMLLQRAGGTVAKVKSFETVEEPAKEPEVTASAADPVTPPATTEPEAAAAAADPPVTADANHDAAAGSPDAPAEEGELDGDDPEKQKAKKPVASDDTEEEEENSEDGSNAKPGKGKAFKSAAFLPDAQKSLTGEAAARAVCDKFYSLVWSLYDAIYNGFAADSTIDEKRGGLMSTLDEFTTVAKRLVEDVIDDYFGEPDGDDDDNGEGGDRTMAVAGMFVKAFETVREEAATKVAAAEAPTKLIAQAESLIAKNRELNDTNVELKNALTEKSGLVNGLHEAIDLIMEMPLARKVNDAADNANVYATMKDAFPYIDERILTDMVARKIKKARA